jgi:hypothetical protein
MKQSTGRSMDMTISFACPMVCLTTKKTRSVLCLKLLSGKLDVSELLNIFEEELAVANPFNEEHAEQISNIRNNVSDILDNLYGYVSKHPPVLTVRLITLLDTMKYHKLWNVVVIYMLV